MYITVLWIHTYSLFLIYVSKTVKKVIQFGINTVRIFPFGTGKEKGIKSFSLKPKKVVIELKNLNSFLLPAWSINHQATLTK